MLTDDPTAWLSDLKTTAAVEEEVDRCVECGFCEPVCPSRSLTMTPRQRIVLRRELALAEARGDTALVEDLRRDYEYDGKQTCAVDGMCATACPVLINTGDLVRRLRAGGRVGTRGAGLVVRRWPLVGRDPGGLRRADGGGPPPGPGAGRPVPRRSQRRWVPTQVPLYDPGLSRGGGRAAAGRRGAGRRRSCSPPASARCSGAARPRPCCALCERAGVRLRDAARLSPGCAAGRRGSPRVTATATTGWPSGCATRWRRATEGGRLPVVVDASSCTEGLLQMLADAGLEVLDATEFVADRVLPLADGHLAACPRSWSTRPARARPRAAPTPCCAWPGPSPTRSSCPASWGCCAFAGDRGLLHPELTAAATGARGRRGGRARPAAGAAYVSGNRTCEIGMTRATGEDYRHVLEVLDAATR